MVAEGWHLDAGGLDGVKDGRALLGLYLLVRLSSALPCCAPYCTPTASRLQTSRQMPHRMHLSSSIDVQLVQFSGDGVLGAVLGAYRAAVAVVRDDEERDQVLADARRALLVPDVRVVLVAEIAEGA